MHIRFLFYFIFFSLFINGFSQIETKQNLDEIIITSNRIELPFSVNSKKITVINLDDINKATISNLTDLLQHVEGIEIVKRGIHGVQSDIKIRGGNFQQTLILIDGFKVEDPQTGHHVLNMLLPLDNIERIEIVKGAASRVYGQNAFSGAINIITKKTTKDNLSASLHVGSYNYFNEGITLHKKNKKAAYQLHFSKQQSDGYQFNTDFNNTNYFAKASFTPKNQPINILATFNEKKFGAQYFYTSPKSNFTEYEETQASLVGISTKYVLTKYLIKPRMYWKRNQDVFLLKRNNPSFSRNHNISNKVGLAIDNSYKSTYGVTGFGIDFALVSLASNNLGNQDRSIFQAFVEHRYVTKNKKFDFTPGIAMGYFSDFGLNTFPGIDVGYKLNELSRIFVNIGSSYRVPTYTELHINIPNFLSGNTGLKPEKAFTQEIGYKYNTNKLHFNTSIFYRVSKDLIDYVKSTKNSTFYKAQNLRTIKTKGFEFNTSIPFEIINYPQKITFSYAFLDDDYVDVSVFKSRYLLNSTVKHQFNASFQTQFIKDIRQTISYRYVDKPLNSYHILDAKLNATINKFNIFFIANNILDVNYFEKEFISMPKSNFEFGILFEMN